jgi:esterase/lipase
VAVDNKVTMSDYSTVTKTIVEETRTLEASLGLGDATCRSRFFLHPHPTEKVVLFFHGFTAVPQQFVPIGEAFFHAGYNLLIPRLPGHGIAGNWDKHNPPPLPENALIYQEFALSWLDKAQALGEKVAIGGLSAASTLAAWLALERPQQIDRALLFAPYLSNTNKVVDWFVQTFDIYYKWKTPPGAINYGYEGFYMPALRLFLNMGKSVLNRSKVEVVAPMFIVSSQSDRAVNHHKNYQLFQSAIARQPRCWYLCFHRALKIPHNMMTKVEGNQYRDLVIAIALAYIQSNLTRAEVQDTREFICQS